jgi:PH (Pleckstrin Homology) domain-containing protein
VSSASPSPAPRTFRLPRSAYLIVLFVLFCTVPLAFAGGTHDATSSATESSGSSTDVEYGPRLLLLLIPIAVTVYIARTRTRVDGDGISVRALLGTRLLAWSELRGLSVSGRSVYAVCADGSVRLPCVGVSDLAALSRASAGRLPEVAPPKPKYAPSRRPSRRR